MENTAYFTRQGLTIVEGESYEMGDLFGEQVSDAFGYRVISPVVRVGEVAYQCDEVAFAFVPCEDFDPENDETYYLCERIETLICSDPNDPGGTEIETVGVYYEPVATILPLSSESVRMYAEEDRLFFISTLDMDD